MCVVFPEEVLCHLNNYGIPSESDLVEEYVRRSGRSIGDEWPVFLAFCAFRNASIIQGVYKRALQGNASSAFALEFRELVPKMAKVGLDITKDFPDGEASVSRKENAATTMKRLQEFMNAEVSQKIWIDAFIPSI